MNPLCLKQKKISLKLNLNVNPIQDGLFRDCSQIGEGKTPPPLPKVCHTYPAMMILGTVIPYPKKIQKIYESRNTDIDCILIHNFYLF